MSSSRPSTRLSQRSAFAADQAIGFLMQQAVENKDCVSLAAGLVDESSLPVEIARDAFADILSSPEFGRTILQYGTTEGSEGPRQAVLNHFARLEDCKASELGVNADSLVLTTGSQQLLALLADALFDPGDICLVAAPTYFVFLSVLSGVGANAIPVKTDESGMCPEALDAKLTQLEAAGDLGRVKLIYLVSYFENPSGVSLSADRRERMVEVAQKWSRDQRIYILEDAAYRELRYDGPALPSVWSFDKDHETVILTQTFSKSFSPGVRVGFGVIPEALRTALFDLKGNRDFGSAHVNQRLIANVLTSGRYQSHVENVCAAYREKRDAMLQAAEDFFAEIPGVSWVDPHGGLYVWMTLPETIRTGFDSEFFKHASQVEKVMYVPGELCYGGKEAARPANQMRLSFGVQSTEGIRDGMRRLANAVKASLAEKAPA